ncbi:hypothetical protein QPK31_24940 [Massilia sp. YIM B02769]|uniref:hypothetical protein n=1 Tax=Massilia sp. YIM B02769 TaxID=3050129 RepID=UPI0025B6A3C7|nr:hypothetical protein [Massilia sp. YIM B02769]MDN4061473.1 hypothetical protein [Massilia sp. YIM B02769]
MATTTLMFKLKVRWWLKLYLAGVMITARLTRAEPNWERVRYWIGKGTKIEVR